MAIVPLICESCQKAIDGYVGQYVSDRQLVWHRSFACPHCETAIEEDGMGMPPHELRQAILAQEGVWSLTVLETDDRAVVATKILRGAMNLSLSDAVKIKRKIPGKVVLGTHAEVEWLSRLLAVRGIRSSTLQEKSDLI